MANGCNFEMCVQLRLPQSFHVGLCEGFSPPVSIVLLGSPTPVFAALEQIIRSGGAARIGFPVLSFRYSIHHDSSILELLSKWTRVSNDVDFFMDRLKGGKAYGNICTQFCWNAATAWHIGSDFRQQIFPETL